MLTLPRIKPRIITETTVVTNRDTLAVCGILPPLGDDEDADPFFTDNLTLTSVSFAELVRTLRSNGSRSGARVCILQPRSS